MHSCSFFSGIDPKFRDELLRHSCSASFLSTSKVFKLLVPFKTLFELLFEFSCTTFDFLVIDLSFLFSLFCNAWLVQVLFAFIVGCVSSQLDFGNDFSVLP